MTKIISPNKIIIFTILFLMLFSSLYLSYTETKLANIDSQNLWLMYFKNPKDNSIDFTIENHSNSNNFHWEILADKDSLKTGDTEILNGQSKTIPINISDTVGKKITITVTDSENKKKEIYKNF